MNRVIHERHLPFTKGQLMEHFRDEKHLDQLVESAVRHLSYMDRYAGRTKGMPVTSEVRRERQLEKDERARTIKAIKIAFDNQTLPSVIERAFRSNSLCQNTDWAGLLGQQPDLTLSFEVGLSSPLSYREQLKSRYADRDPELCLLPYIEDAASGRTSFEGATRVDALLVNQKTDFSLSFEAKFLSDTSVSVTFDPFRNQVIRNLDVLMDPQVETLNASPSRRYFCLLTPAVFRNRPRSRHFGALFTAYTSNPSSISEDLPHRDPNLASDMASRMGWATFEDFEATS